MFLESQATSTPTFISMNVYQHLFNKGVGDKYLLEIATDSIDMRYAIPNPKNLPYSP
jgi:hypothetical protein